jgi:hypothetical protein
MLQRAGKLMPWIVRPAGDPTWSAADWGRAATLEAKWKMAGVSESDRRSFIPCAVWAAKFPGIVYDAPVTRRLQELAATTEEKTE